MSERARAIRTARLDLVPGTLAIYAAELESTAALARALGADVPPGWPPGEHDRGAVEFFAARTREDPAAAAGWYAWYMVERGDGQARDRVVGSVGTFGPPRDGVVEIGYSVVESCRGRGFATEGIRALTGRAFATPGVERVIAHTAADNAPSQGALRRCGFRDVGAGDAPGMRRFERLAGD